MDAIINERLDELETALDTLIATIVSYNPSPSAADALLAASDKLDVSVEQLERHYYNHLRILQLRRETELLDTQIKASVQTLADVRRELLAIPLSTAKDEGHPVPYKELLAYAKNIADFTIPKSFRPKPPRTEPSKAANGTAAAFEGKNTEDTKEGVEAKDVVLTDAPPAGEPTSDDADRGRGFEYLTDEQKGWIASLNAQPFLPWPGLEEMNGGALRALQVAIGDRGEDFVMGVKPADQVAQPQHMDVEIPGLGAHAQPSAQAQMQLAGQRRTVATAVETQKAKFGLDDDDDDDDEDD